MSKTFGAHGSWLFTRTFALGGDNQESKRTG